MTIMGLYGKLTMEPVDSEMFRTVGYDYSHHDLYVEFSNTGAVYVYREVPRDEFIRLRDASSVGRYYNDNIKGQYAAARLENLITNGLMPEVRKASQSCLQDIVDELDERADSIQAKIDALDAEIDKLVDQKTIVEKARDLLLRAENE